MEKDGCASSAHSLRRARQRSGLRGGVRGGPRSVRGRRGVERGLLVRPPTGGGITRRCKPTLGASVVASGEQRRILRSAPPPCPQPRAVERPSVSCTAYPLRFVALALLALVPIPALAQKSESDSTALAACLRACSERPIWPCGATDPAPLIGLDSLRSLMRAPYPHGKTSAEGIVVVRFDIAADGSSAASVARGVDPVLDSVAVRLARPIQWRPSVHECYGPEPSRYAVPFYFRRSWE